MLYLHFVLLPQADEKSAVVDGFQMFLYSIR